MNLEEKELRITQILKEKRMSHGLDNPANYLQGLKDLIDKYVKPEFRICEIGSYEGSSTELFLLSCDWVTSIDPYNEGEFFGQENLEDLDRAEKIFIERNKNYDRLTKIKKKSKFAVDDFGIESFDLFYHDGDHRIESVCADLLMWLPKIKKDGYLAGHDYCDDVKIAVDKIIGEPDEVFQDSSWIKKKSNILI
jgi:predicted O-methyltransferase YrrM